MRNMLIRENQFKSVSSVFHFRFVKFARQVLQLLLEEVVRIADSLVVNRRAKPFDEIVKNTFGLEFADIIVELRSTKRPKRLHQIPPSFVA